MKKPVVGIIANFFLINDQCPAQTSGNMNIEAIAQVAGAVPMIIPGLPDCVDIDEIMGVCQAGSYGPKNAITHNPCKAKTTG